MQKVLKRTKGVHVDGLPKTPRKGGGRRNKSKATTEKVVDSTVNDYTANDCHTQSNSFTPNNGGSIKKHDTNLHDVTDPKIQLDDKTNINIIISSDGNSKGSNSEKTVILELIALIASIITIFSAIMKILE